MGAYRHGGQNLNYYPSAHSASQVTVTHPARTLTESTLRAYTLADCDRIGFHWLFDDTCPSGLLTFTAFRNTSMMTSSNGNIFRVTGPLCEEFNGDRWIPQIKSSDAELWCFLWSAPWINVWVNTREAGDLRRHRVQNTEVFFQESLIEYIICKMSVILPRCSGAKYDREILSSPRFYEIYLQVKIWLCEQHYLQR